MPGIWVYRGMRAGSAKFEDIGIGEEKAPAPQNLQARGPAVAPGRVVSGLHQLRGDPRHRVILGMAKPRPDSNAEKGHSLSSGSEHEPSSVCLAAMVHDFMEDQSGRNVGSKDASKDRIKEELGGELREILKGLVPCTSEIELVLAAEAAKAVDEVRRQASEICRDDGADCTSGCLRRATMKFLREAGYNAAICKSRWDHAGGFPAGDYEYMDVLIEKDGGVTERLIVDVDFRGQFEIARATERYTSIFQELPPIFVGAPDRLQQIVNLISGAIKQSLKKREMPVPPWRKPEYMRAKWFSAYKRTSNEIISPHESSEAILNRELRRTAIRGSRWDSRKFTAAFEAHHQLSSDGDEITVVTTDWKPPPAVERRSQRPSRVAGLASVLIEAGLSTLAKQQQQQQLSSLVAVS